MVYKSAIDDMLQFYYQLNMVISINYLLQYYYMQASPQQITAKFHQMGVLLLLDAPAQLEFGIDNITWQVGSKFKGIKLIPLGTHIITYALKNQNYMFPIKKFINFGPTSKSSKDDDRIRVFRWSPKAEKFVTLIGEEAEGYREGVNKYHFDCYLGPYPAENIQFWAMNTKYITKEVLDKLDPIQSYNNYEEQYTNNKMNRENQKIDIDSQSQGEADEADLGKQQINDIQINEDNDDQPKQKSHNERPESQNVSEIKKNKDFGGNIYYSEIPRRLSQSSTHTTFVNIDRTEILQSIIKTSWASNQFNILGELQYSFIAFLIGQCLDSFNQWKQLTMLLSMSETAFITHKNLMLEFIIVLYEQLRQFPSDFFMDDLAKGNFLTQCFQSFNYYRKQGKIGKKAVSRVDKLLSLVNQKFQYIPDDENENPVVVGQDEGYF